MEIKTVCRSKRQVVYSIPFLFKFPSGAKDQTHTSYVRYSDNTDKTLKSFVYPLHLVFVQCGANHHRLPTCSGCKHHAYPGWPAHHILQITKHTNVIHWSQKGLYHMSFNCSKEDYKSQILKNRGPYLIKHFKNHKKSYKSQNRHMPFNGYTEDCIWDYTERIPHQIISVNIRILCVIIRGVSQEINNHNNFITYWAFFLVKFQ